MSRALSKIVVGACLACAGCGVSHPDELHDAGGPTAVDIMVEAPGFLVVPTVSDAPNPADTGDETELDASTAIDLTVSTSPCPQFQLAIVGAREINLGAPAVYEAHATGVSRGALAFAWSVSQGGELSSRAGARTELTCTEGGPMAITLWAGIGGECSTAMASALFCQQTPE